MPLQAEFKQQIMLFHVASMQMSLKLTAYLEIHGQWWPVHSKSNYGQKTTPFLFWPLVKSCDCICPSQRWKDMKLKSQVYLTLVHSHPVKKKWQTALWNLKGLHIYNSTLWTLGKHAFPKISVLFCNNNLRFVYSYKKCSAFKARGGFWVQLFSAPTCPSSEMEVVWLELTA